MSEIEFAIVVLLAVAGGWVIGIVGFFQAKMARREIAQIAARHGRFVSGAAIAVTRSSIARNSAMAAARAACRAAAPAVR